LLPAQAIEPPNHFPLDALRDLPILNNGRYKPLDTFAGETMKTITGRWRFNKNDHVAMLVSLLAFPEWTHETMIRIDYLPAKIELDLDQSRNHYSFNELAGNAGLQQAFERIGEKQRRNIKLDRLESELGSIFHQLSLFQEVMNGNELTIVPPPPGADEEAAWHTISQADGYSQETLGAMRETYSRLITSVRQANASAFEQASLQLRTQMAQLNPQIYPQIKEMEREIHYNHFRPFLKSWILYLIAFLLFLFSFGLERKTALYWSSFAIFVLGFALNTYGLLLRSLISGRPPVSNMYESVVFVGWGIIAFALIFELVYRERWFVTIASALGVCMLVLADLLPFDPNIEPLVPVLRSNYWLLIHVLTITLSYSAFALAMGLAHVNLGIYFYLPHRRDLLAQMSLFLYRMLQVGVVFLFAGTVLGGVWAAESWGRFWGWDPKETWALISLLGYIAILHARHTGWLRDFGVAVCSVLGFWLILMTWYGVNFILATGLHSYGFGSGGGKYVLAYMIAEVIFLIAVAMKYKTSAFTKFTPVSSNEL
jgi:cytochrome c-type biogenesis protein CcsB